MQEEKLQSAAQSCNRPAGQAGRADPAQTEEVYASLLETTLAWRAIARPRWRPTCASALADVSSTLTNSRLPSAKRANW